MIRVGVSKKYFKIKLLTPIYPLYKQKFVDPNYYQKEEKSIELQIKEEQLIN